MCFFQCSFVVVVVIVVGFEAVVIRDSLVVWCLVLGILRVEICDLGFGFGRIRESCE